MRRWLIGAVVAATMLGGCGIPAETPAVPIGPGPALGTSAGDNAAQRLPRRENAEKPAQLVRDYLEQAAGDPDDAVARAKTFLAPTFAAQFKPQPGTHVVALVDAPLNNPGSDVVTVNVRQVGTLDRNGTLDPSTDGTPVAYKFVVTHVAGQAGLFIGRAPQMLLLSLDALNNNYDLRTIYFWNNDNTALVPDVRYMPKSLPREQRPTEVINWVVGGPSPWLDGAVQQLPGGTQTIGNVPAVSNDTLQISFNDKVADPNDRGALDRLRQQLMWSLRPDLPGYLELKIGHANPQRWGQTNYLDSNASYRLAGEPERFVVYNGQIRRLKNSLYQDDPVPVLPPTANRNVMYAALSSSNTHTYAAVVVNDGGKPALQVAGAPTGTQVLPHKVNVPGKPGSLGHPVWAVTPQEAPGGPIGLITAGGRLYRFGPQGGNAQEIDWPGGGPPAISAVAVAPDAQRIALVVGGRLYLSVLSNGGDGLQLGTPQQIPTPMRELTGVDWSSEGWLVIAGTRADNGRVAITDITIDGALTLERLTDLGIEQVSYVTAYPASPLDSREVSGSVAYVAGDAANVALSDATRLTTADLAQPVANAPPNAALTSPLFLR